jgi:hypothetical protein
MQTVFETCDPRPEVLRGELREESFAARLRDVIERRADPVYGDPTVFFANTYPTDGLRTLLAEALGRLTGSRPENNAIIRLETAFGGGKTHNLIALYHLASGATPSIATQPFVDTDLIPAPGQVTVAGIVGTDLDAEGGVTHGDVTAHTLWGELAWQVADKAGYELVADSDRTFAAPGTAMLERLLALSGDRPCLILLDEIARHLRGAAAVPTATGASNLAEQTVAFLVSLLEFAASREHVVVVLTLADSSDAFGRETDELRTDIGDARKISARTERVITPTRETEISAIVTHRLFARIDRDAARVTADTYSEAYRHLLEQGVELPERSKRSEYRDELVSDYPFHPELLTTLNRKVATIPNFQKTRGALRLLALTVRQLWATRPDGSWTIHPDHVDLGVAAIADDLTSRLDRPTYRQVIEADIASPRLGSLAHAQELDRRSREAARPAFAVRVATAIFLHSITQGIGAGVDPADVALAVLRPGDDPLLISRASDALVDSCWYLDFDTHRLRFQPEASITKVIADEAALVGTTKAKEEVDRRIRDGLIWKKGAFRPIAFPSEPAEVDDDAGAPKLVILHYDAASASSAEASPPDLVRRLFERTGSSESFRQYRNNLVFLLADHDAVERMVETSQRHIALGRVTGSAERLSEFTGTQRGKLKALRDESDLALRIAITSAYRFLYYPSADAPQRDANLAREPLPAQDQGAVKDDQTLVVVRQLRSLQKVLTADDAPLAAAYVKAKAWDQNQAELSTDDLRRAFARRMALRILLDEDQLKRTIRAGILDGTWVYYEAGASEAYGKSSPSPLVRISGDAFVATPEDARARGLAIKGERPTEERCPVCGNPIDACTCDKGSELAKPRLVRQLLAEGPPAQALQALVDQAADQRVARLAWLGIELQGTGAAGANELAALGLMVPQLGKVDARITQSLSLEFDGGDYLQASFAGEWDRYKRLKSTTESMAREASKLVARTTLRLSAPDGFEVTGALVTTLREVLGSLQFGRVALTAEPVEAEEPDSSSRTTP